MERVEGMPIRVVCVKSIKKGGELKRDIPVGEVFDLSDYYFELLSRKFPECIQEIVMTQEDWVDLATKNAFTAKKRIDTLQALSGRKFSSYYWGVIPDHEDEKVTGHGYGGGLPDAYNKTKLLLKDVDDFEKNLLEATRNIKGDNEWTK